MSHPAKGGKSEESPLSPLQYAAFVDKKSTNHGLTPFQAGAHSGQAGEHVAQVGERIFAVAFAGDDQRVENGGSNFKGSMRVLLVTDGRNPM